MNLHYTLDKIAALTAAKVYDPIGLPKDYEIRNFVADTRNPAVTGHSVFVALKGSRSDGHTHLTKFRHAGGRIALVEKADETLSLYQLVVNDPLKALQQIAAYHRSQFSFPVIGITGSNGKTIVKEWLYHLLKDHYHIVRSPKSYNSQLGVALSVLEIGKEHSLGIFEAGISRPGEMETLERIIQPTIGVFTGIGDAHGANFKSRESKQAEKYLLFKKVSQIFDTPLETPDVQIPFSDEASLSNAALAAQVALSLGLSKEQLQQGLKTLPTVSMRLEQTQGIRNCLLVNDAYNADIQSLEIALKQLQHISKHSSRILFITPFDESDSRESSALIESLVLNANLSEIVVIGAHNLIKQNFIPVSHFSSAEEYLEKGKTYSNSVLLFKGSRRYGLEKIVSTLAEKKHITRLVVNFAALRRNLNYFRGNIEPGTKILVMVKAHSYGGGLTEMAHFLKDQNVDYFGVAYADEGVLLRKSGIHLPIMVMNPEQNSFDDLIDFDLEPSIYSTEILNSFIHHLILRQKQNYPVHLKLDTGMHRLGFVEEDIPFLLNTLDTQPEIYIKSVFSHLSAADDENETEFTNTQVRKFNILSGQIQDHLSYTFFRHLANSAGAINFRRANYDMVRLGIGIFGLVDKQNNALENVLTLTTQISQIKMIHTGESVGYGRTYIATKDHLIAVIPVGYADGLRRGLSGGNWQVIVQGKAAPIIGNICMDMCMINLDGIDAKTGDEVVVFGENNSIFDMAENLRTIPYEIIAGISSRVHRVYVDE